MSNRLLKVTGIRDSFKRYGCFLSGFQGNDGDPPNTDQFIQNEQDLGIGVIKSGALYYKGYDIGTHGVIRSRWAYKTLIPSTAGSYIDVALNWENTYRYSPNGPGFTFVAWLMANESQTAFSTGRLGQLGVTAGYSGGSYTAMKPYVDNPPGIGDYNGSVFTTGSQTESGRLRMYCEQYASGMRVTYYWMRDGVHTSWQLLSGPTAYAFGVADRYIHYGFQVGDVTNSPAIRGHESSITKIEVLDKSSNVSCPS